VGGNFSFEQQLQNNIVPRRDPKVHVSAESSEDTRSGFPRGRRIRFVFSSVPLSTLVASEPRWRTTTRPAARRFRCLLSLPGHPRQVASGVRAPAPRLVHARRRDGRHRAGRALQGSRVRRICLVPVHIKERMPARDWLCSPGGCIASTYFYRPSRGVMISLV